MAVGGMASNSDHKVKVEKVEDLEVYRLSRELFHLFMEEDLRILERSLAGRELAKQMVRSLDSVCSNLEEAFGRRRGKEFAQFIRIARGSARESRGRYLRLRSLLPGKVIQERAEKLDRVSKMLFSLLRSLEYRHTATLPYRHTNDRGSVLIVSLWSVSLLSIFLFSLAFQGGIQAKVMKRELSEFYGHQNLLSGLNLASQAIESDSEPHTDHLEDIWYGELKLEEPWNERVSITAQDEESKLNLNSASETLLRTLLELLTEEGELEFDSEPKEIAKAVTKWREKKKTKTFESLEELLLLEEVSKKDFEILKPYFTVFTESSSFPRVNINTVRPLILKSILSSISGDDFAKKELLEKVMELGKPQKDQEGPSYLTQEDLEPRLLIQRLKLPSNVQMLGLINQILPYLTTDSKVFSLRLKALEQGKEAEAVIELLASEFPPMKVSSWQEE